MREEQDIKEDIVGGDWNPVKCYITMGDCGRASLRIIVGESQVRYRLSDLASSDARGSGLTSEGREGRAVHLSGKEGRYGLMSEG